VAEPDEAVRGTQDRHLFARAHLDPLATCDAEQARRDTRAQPRVATDGRDRDEIELFGTGEQETECQRIVDVRANVGVEQDPARQN
jgi:hypothetical protein